MAACWLSGELSGQFLIENDSDFSDSGDSDSEEEQAIDDNIYSYPNDVEGRNSAENDEYIESAGSDFDSDDNQNVDVNGVSEIAFVNEDTLGQVFISSERDDASANKQSNKASKASKSSDRYAKSSNQQQQPQFIWNQNNPINIVPEFLLSPSWSNSCVGRWVESSHLFHVFLGWCIIWNDK